jgi:hypothetical protein
MITGPAMSKGTSKRDSNTAKNGVAALNHATPHSKWKNKQLRVLMIEVMRFSEYSYQRYLNREVRMVTEKNCFSWRSSAKPDPPLVGLRRDAALGR